MAILSHILGFPRIGLQRELKKALEQYWNGGIGQSELLFKGRELRMRHWLQQCNSGIDFISVGDFAWYDHVLTTSVMLDNIPSRFRNGRSKVNIDTLFCIARGSLSSDNEDSGNGNKRLVIASEMKKWFNTNYHYIVPEFFVGQNFKLVWNQLFDEVDEALSLGCNIKVVLLGPLSYLWLGKMKSASHSRLSLLPGLLLVYRQILQRLAKMGVCWVQVDEPILVLELPERWRNAYPSIYKKLHGFVKLLLTTYFGSIEHQMDIIPNIPVDGLHVDLVSGDDSLHFFHDLLPENWILSVGVVNGRNIWRADLRYWFNKLVPFTKKRCLWVGSSCSLLHVPVDLNSEELLDNKFKGQFAFAVQKCHELKELSSALNNVHASSELYQSSFKRVFSDGNSGFLKSSVDAFSRIPYKKRVVFQRKRFNLPVCPTTTVGSFPQTINIRMARLDFKSGRLDSESYDSVMKKYIREIILEQEKLGLDVLVHGEPERSDMVEYFAEHLNGFVITCNGWIQSYGSRCVKPPIIFSDITWSQPITTKWITYAQSLTNKPVKGILTGPVTMLSWSFSREDLSREVLACQIAKSIRCEVLDLEKNRIGIIQIDEPAFREGLPLKVSSWKYYLSWAVKCFKMITSVVSHDVQIHTHMCYSAFDDIIDAIVELDVDVLSIEASRIDVVHLGNILHKLKFFNAIGPGVYDIHSPHVPSKKIIGDRLLEILKYVDINRLWINPDCGLKTRSWIEVRKALLNMVEVAKRLRIQYLNE